MESELLCGSACINYIITKDNKKNSIKIKPNMIWAPELAIALQENEYKDITIYYYRSKLVEDFKIQSQDESFEGFLYLRRAISEGIKVCEKKISRKILSDEIKQNKYIILCVKSSVFNKDNTMDGGHFVILTDIYKNKIKIINPVKKKYEEKWLKINFLLKCCSNYGAWRILIRKENAYD